ncbi:MAG: glycoside hydrolase family 3 C-terminal domain-containing protein [Bacteroidota bacterium]
MPIKYLLSKVFILLTFMALGQERQFPFQNPDLPLEERVEDLISRMTLEEKLGQLMYTADAIPRLDIPEYNWWNECLHGVARNGRATVFPQAIGMAATFDTDLVHKVARVISTEARAKYNSFSSQGYRGRYQGLTFWTPNINIFRDPRWGRGQETYGEDPYLTSRIGVSFVKGLQGDHPKYVQAAGCAKHFAVHNGPEATRHEFDAVVSQKDLWETYLPAFEALVIEAKVEGVMGAYNLTNGDPCCAHPYLMRDILRKQWEFNGYFVSDCWALVDFYNGHKLVETPEEAAALALNHGCNLNCGSTYPSLSVAIDQGLTTEDEVDRNLKELLPTRFRLGLFDPPGSVPFDTIGTDMIRHRDHVNLSRKVATESMVLLKNKNNLLPLQKDLSSIYVCGPMATHAQALLANYYGVSEDMATFLEGVTGAVSHSTKIRYSQSALLDRKNINPIDWFSQYAEITDVTIAFVGISQLIEGEEGESIASPTKGDRMDIRLPQSQIDFLKLIRSKARNLVVVITSGSAIACPEIYEMADALIYAWYPGEQGGRAAADILFGDVTPSGKLPITVPYAIEDLPPYEDYAMEGRTYRYTEKAPLFPFGFGLSYTDFEYSDLKLSKEQVSGSENLEVSVLVANNGSREGQEVVQLYISDLESSVDLPKYALKRFQKINIKQGETKEVVFQLSVEDLKIVNEKGEKELEKGFFRVFVGGASPSARVAELGGAQFESSEFELK